MKRNDTYWMDRCLQLAKRGTGTVSPNPLVGAVIVKNGRKIGEGYHERFGGNHAEINAFRDAFDRNLDVNGADLYVNLEPCSHFGKTPPCVDAVIRHGIARVIIGTIDPNPAVAGRGIERLHSSNISVKLGVRSRQAAHLNEAFFKMMRTGMPLVTLKAALTADGFIARQDGSSKWISNSASRRFVHQLRSSNDAVLVGSGTVLKDDPELTVRSVPGRNPVRVILDTRFRISTDRTVFNRAAKTIIYTSFRSIAREPAKVRSLEKRGVTVVPIRTAGKKSDLQMVLQDLGRRGISSVLIEGGSEIYTSMMNAKLVDRMAVFTAKKKFSSGIKMFGKISVSFKKKLISERSFYSDRFQEFRITFT